MRPVSSTFLIGCLLLTGFNIHPEPKGPKGPQGSPGPAHLSGQPAPTGLTLNDQAIIWLNAMQGPRGLVESSECTNFVSLYDNALAALAYLKTGAHDRAKRILDYFQARQDYEFAESGGGFFQTRDARGGNRSRIWMGDNAWLLLALKHYRHQTGSNAYNKLIAQLEGWIRGLQQADGSLLSGTNADGRPIPLVTEGMLTAFAAIDNRDVFRKNLMAFLKAERWDSVKGMFVCHSANLPYASALDLQSLAALLQPRHSKKFIEAAEQFRCRQKHTKNKIAVEGFSFDTDRDVVWLEGSAQMALAYRQAGDLVAYRTVIRELDRAFVAGITPAGGKGLPYATNPGSSYGTEPLWPHASSQPAVSSTAWYIFARINFNPLLLPSETVY